MAYHDALMDKPSGLTQAEREMIVVATSAVNQCQYCIIAHGAILRIRAKNPLIADQVAGNYRKADITQRQRAMLDFAMKVSQQAQEVGEADSVMLREHSFSDDEIWDIATISAFFGCRTIWPTSPACAQMTSSMRLAVVKQPGLQAA
jgi:uncharacterized peroxidase-related enzyme